MKLLTIQTFKENGDTDKVFNIHQFKGDFNHEKFNVMAEENDGDFSLSEVKEELIIASENEIYVMTQDAGSFCNEEMFITERKDLKTLLSDIEDYIGI